jgi:5'-3' exonuclease
LPKNSNIKQLINNRSRNILFLLTKNKTDDIISFLISGVDNISGIIGIGEKTEKIDSYNIINNIISRIDIFLFLIKIIY